jgi:hypothetical protein
LSPTTTNVFTSYKDNLVFTGGITNTKGFAIGADGNFGSNIPAGSDKNGCGFIEVNTVAKIPLGQSAGIWSAVVTCEFDWST